MTLVETGTRALLGAVFGPPATGEIDYARRLLAPAETGHAGAGRPRLRRRRVPGRGRRHRAQFLVRLRVHPPPAGAGPPRRRLVPVPDRRADRADHRPRDVTVTCADGTRYTGELPAGHHPGRPPPLPRPRADPPVPRAVGTRDRLPGAAAHPRCDGRVLRSDRPGRPANRKCGRCSPSTRRCAGPWSPPPKPVPGTDPDRASFTIALETAKQTLTQAAGVVTDDTTTSSAASAAPSSTTCSRPAAPGSASARSNPRCRARTRPTRTGPSAAPRSPP